MNPRIVRVLLLIMISVAEIQSGKSAETIDCIASVNPISFKAQPLPTEIRPSVPSGAFVRLVLPLSTTDVLTVYELGKRTEPNAVLLITRGSQPIFRFLMSHLRLPEGYDKEWAIGLTPMWVAHLCSNHADITYLVLQAGNQGGYFAALQRHADKYLLVPIKPVSQGRLELKVSTPSRITVWSSAVEDAVKCTACPKHYTVETMELDGRSFRIVATTKTKATFVSFQDKPLVVRP